jgi:hypothetical protein
VDAECAELAKAAMRTQIARTFHRPIPKPNWL